LSLVLFGEESKPGMEVQPTTITHSKLIVYHNLDILRPVVQLGKNVCSYYG